MSERPDEPPAPAPPLVRALDLVVALRAEVDEILDLLTPRPDRRNRALGALLEPSEALPHVAGYTDAGDSSVEAAAPEQTTPPRGLGRLTGDRAGADDRRAETRPSTP